MQNYASVSKPFLLARNIPRHKRWAPIHSTWKQNQWDSVIISDEFSFTVLPRALSNRAWREANTRYHLSDLALTYKPGIVSLTVWAVFSKWGWTTLVRIQGTMNQEQYCDILNNQLIPFIYSNYKSVNDPVFQQENCGPHRAKSVSADAL